MRIHQLGVRRRAASRRLPPQLPRPRRGEQPLTFGPGKPVGSSHAPDAFLAQTISPVWVFLAAPRGLRLTGIGSGLLACGSVAATALFTSWLSRPAPVLCGVMFLLSCAASAYWVRNDEVFAAPVAAPVAFMVGLLVSVRPGPGGAGYLMGVMLALAWQAPWMFAGTVLGATIACLRWIALTAVERAHGDRLFRRDA